MAQKEPQKNNLVEELQIGSSLRMLRQNGLYIGSLVVFMLVGVIGLPKAWSHFKEIREKATSEKKAVEQLESALLVQKKYESFDPQKLLEAVDQLMPQKEDYFNLIQSMQQLARANGVTLVTHTSPFKSKTKDVTSVSVTMKGSRVELERVLGNYSFVSGRFITIDSVTYKPRERLITFDIQYHTAPRLGTGGTLGTPPELLINELLQSRPPVSVDDTSVIETPSGVSGDPFKGEDIVLPVVPVASGTAE